MLTLGLNSNDQNITKDRRDKEIAQIFNMFDKDGNGNISTDELQSFLTAIGEKPTKDDIKKIIKSVDKDKDGFINLDEFIAYIDETYVISEDQITEVVDAFQIFDFDKSGSISKDEFTNILVKFGDKPFEPQEIDQIFSMIDVNKDGLISYAEFIDMWKYKA